MRVLCDQGTPVPLHKHLTAHEVETVFERGWSTLTNGELLVKAEEQGFEVLVATDKNLHDQQNLAARSIAILVLSTTSWPRIRMAATAINQAIESMLPRSLSEIDIP